MLQIDRLKNILLSPKTEWPVIAGETATVQSLYVGYIMILAAIGPIALALRFGIAGAGITFAIANYLVSLAVVYLLALLVDALAPSFGGEKNFIRSLQLVAVTAAWPKKAAVWVNASVATEVAAALIWQTGLMLWRPSQLMPAPLAVRGPCW